LNDVSPCDVVDLEKIVSPSRPILRVLGKLLDLGLIEREGDSLYRLTPLLANRLSRDLIRPDLLAWLRGALVQFLARPIEMDAPEHEYLRIESRIQASILADTDSTELPQSVLEFVSAAHWFQAGVRLYHARRREPAYRILKRAYSKRAEFSTASRTELTRYFCLSATRNRRYKEAEECIQRLDGVHQTKGMAAFLRADLLEHRGKFLDAVHEYRRSLDLNRDKATRLERTYRPLIKCILSSPRPDFAEAESYAEDWLSVSTTVFGLMARARIYLHWKYRGEAVQRSVPADVDGLYVQALQNLADDPGVGSAHFELKAEEAEFSGDFSASLEYMDKAVEADPRFELRTQRWRLMASSRSRDVAERALRELDAAKHNSEFRGNWHPFLPQLAETYALALKAAGRGLGAVNAFAPELSSEDIAPIVARVRRA
jgi:tetratricopeptide (TPR) repeat protein